MCKYVVVLVLREGPRLETSLVVLVCGPSESTSGWTRFGYGGGCVGVRWGVRSVVGG